MANRPLIALCALVACVLCARAPAQKDTYDEFLQAITQSIRLGDEKRLDKSVRDNPMHTVSHYRGLVITTLRDPSKDNAADKKALEEAWSRVYESRTLEMMSRWLQSLDQSQLTQMDKGAVALAKAYGQLALLEKEKVQDRQPYIDLIQALMKIAQVLGELGDAVNAADAWGVIARVYTVIPDRTVADQREGVFAIERFLEHRDRWQWKDDHYLKNENWAKAERERIKVEEATAEKRKAEGYDGDARGVEAYLVPDADSKEIVAELSFEMLDEPKIDMSPQGGPVPMQWPAVSVTNEGPAMFQWFKGADVFLVRPGANEFGVTLRKPSEEPQRGDVVEAETASQIKDPTRFALDAEGQRPYAMWFFVGGSQETYQGINQNLQPTPDRAVVYYKSASSWVAEVDGTEITFYDDNTNGLLFETDPLAYGLKDRNLGAGPDEEVPVPAFDSMKIGKGPIQPYSEWVQIDDVWYHVRGKDDGRKVGLRPVNPEYFKTGEVQLEWSGGRATQPAVLIVQGRGDFGGARFDLSGGKPVEVPAGEYELAFGRIESGKGARMMTANVFPGTFEKFTVEPDKTAQIELGAPFQLDFTKGGSDTMVEIDALTIRVRGRGGEIYTHINGATPAPEVLVARGEDGKGARPSGEFQPIRDPETLNRVATAHATLGSQVGFYPIPDGSDGTTVLKVEVPPGHFVGLQEKKNKLFGKLEPIFK